MSEQTETTSKQIDGDDMENMLAKDLGDDRDCVPPAIRLWTIREALRAVYDGGDDGEFSTVEYGAAGWSAVAEYLKRCADDALRLHYHLLPEHVAALRRKLCEIRLARPPEKVRSPEEEVAAHQGDFLQCQTRWRGVEYDALITTLLPGEKIAGVTNDRIITDRREIGRYSLREARSGYWDPQFIAEWEGRFPTRDEIERAPRPEENDEGA